MTASLIQELIPLSHTGCLPKECAAMQVRKALDEAPYTCEEAVQLRLVDGSAYRYSTIEDGNPLTRTPRLNSPAIFMKSLVTVLCRDEVATQIETEAPKTRVPLAKYISTEVRSKTKAEVCCTSHLSCVLYHKAASLLYLRSWQDSGQEWRAAPSVSMQEVICCAKVKPWILLHPKAIHCT